MDETETYYADFLKKEDLTGKWRLYWASLNATGIYFRQEKTAPEQNDNFQQLIELSPDQDVCWPNDECTAFALN